jgi:hypothetical protein
MPFLQEQKTVTGASLSRHLERENTGCNTCSNVQSDAQFLFIAFRDEIFLFALLTGDG